MEDTLHGDNNTYLNDSNKRGHFKMQWAILKQFLIYKLADWKKDGICLVRRRKDNKKHQKLPKNESTILFRSLGSQFVWLAISCLSIFYSILLLFQVTDEVFDGDCLTKV